MKEICAGDRRYRIYVVERNGEWVAHAEHADSGDRFGVECAGLLEAGVVDRLSRWLAWQHEHAMALTTLQVAERAYHRMIAGTAFAGQTVGQGDGHTDCPAGDPLKDALEQVDVARIRLDAIRSRKPE